MQLYYLYNSAIAAVMDKSLLIFDYYKDMPGEGLAGGTVGKADIENAQRVYAFASHSHYDHFNRRIFKWAEINPEIKYILDSTIHTAKLPDKVVTLSKGKIFEDGYIFAREFGSTDIGGSFYVECEGVKFYHAGDFNYWHWKDDGDVKYTQALKRYFDKELKFLRDNVDSIDYAFFPLDNRLGTDYDEGADIFIETMKPKVFIPIHFQRFEDTETYSKKQFPGTAVMSIDRNGQRLV